VRLSEFIRSNLEEILQEWEAFARTIRPGRHFDRAALRDDAGEMLLTIAQDMETPQTPTQQSEKSKGRGGKTATDTSAETHSFTRLGQGFNQVQALSEFRAVRASVIRLWMNTAPKIDDTAMNEMIRFNEGIDDAITESTARFMEEIEKSRDFATAVLAHDLRNPLNAVLSTAQFLHTTGSVDRPTLVELSNNIIHSGSQMSKLIDDLLDFTRTRLGQTLPVKCVETDLVPICRQTVAELAAAHPACTINLSCPDSLRGTFDETRIGQMLSNLVGNAVYHGLTSTPVTVTLGMERDHVILRVHNEGDPIPESALSTIFQLAPPMRKEDKDPPDEPSHLGIGLFIVRKVVEAHSGSLTVTSTSEAGTTFVVRLPTRSQSTQSP
jgi:signal transduction histidine kinase